MDRRGRWRQHFLLWLRHTNMWSNWICGHCTCMSVHVHILMTGTWNWLIQHLWECLYAAVSLRVRVCMWVRVCLKCQSSFTLSSVLCWPLSSRLHGYFSTTLQSSPTFMPGFRIVSTDMEASNWNSSWLSWPPGREGEAGRDGRSTGDPPKHSRQAHTSPRSYCRSTHGGMKPFHAQEFYGCWLQSAVAQHYTRGRSSPSVL